MAHRISKMIEYPNHREADDNWVFGVIIQVLTHRGYYVQLFLSFSELFQIPSWWFFFIFWKLSKWTKLYFRNKTCYLNGITLCKIKIQVMTFYTEFLSEISYIAFGDTFCFTGWWNQSNWSSQQRSNKK